MSTSAPRPVSFVNGRGERLAGSLHGDPRQGLVISCHGMLSDKDGPKHRLLAELLAAHNVATLRFDFAGCGGSEGTLYNLTYSGRAHDLAAAVDWAAGEGVGRLALFGSSLGGSVALLAAARDERVLAVATLAAVANPALMLELNPQAVDSWERLGYVDTERGRVGRAFLDDSLARDVVAAVKILRIPVLIVHGEEDEVVPCREAHDLATAARTATLDLVAGADHGFTRPVHLRPAMAHIAAFLAAQLASAG